MKAFILVDTNDIVQCMASEESNLHKNKLHMAKHHVEIEGIVGDEYKNGKWTAIPANYPPETEDVLNEQKINAEIRRAAIQTLIANGDLPPGYK